MTQEQMIELARRAVACKGWRFMGGMLLAEGVWQARVGEGWRWKEDAELLPVLEDPATLGCLLALVREAWGDPHASASWDYETNGPVVVACSHTSRWIFRDRQTEAEALVAALEAAP